MAKQLGIVQSVQDEDALLGWLRAQGEIVCLPAEMEMPLLDTFNLGECQERKQVMFFSSCLAEVIGNIQKINGKQTYHVHPKNGLCIEWSRSYLKSNNCLVPGRIFYENKNAGWPDIAKELDKFYERLRKWVVKNSPLCTDARFPVYVGEDLAEKLETGVLKVVYRGGSDMAFIKNPKYQKS